MDFFSRAWNCCCSHSCLAGFDSRRFRVRTPTSGRSQVSCRFIPVSCPFSRTVSSLFHARFVFDSVGFPWVLPRFFFVLCPKSYAREKTVVTIREVAMSDNVAATAGSVVFVVDESNVRTYQVIELDASTWRGCLRKKKALPLD